MHKRIVYLLLTLCPTIFIQAQFYYSDIMGNKTTNQLYQLHIDNKVKSVTVKNVIEQAEDEENRFAFKQIYLNNRQELKTILNLPNGGERIYTMFYTNNKVAKKEDDGKNLNSLIRYEYNGQNQLAAIYTSSIDTSLEHQDGFFEKHLFYYGADGKPSKMYKIKNTYDTTTVLFVKDEMGNTGEERWYRKNEIIETYYYYYNDKKQLTDIVRFNDKYQKMLPEFLFEYGDNGQLLQMKQIPFGSSNYTVVKYFYNTAGLKTYEELYTKRGELLSKLEYDYGY